MNHFRMPTRLRPRCTLSRSARCSTTRTANHSVTATRSRLKKRSIPCSQTFTSKRVVNHGNCSEPPGSFQTKGIPDANTGA